eukprot:g60520.t1
MLALNFGAGDSMWASLISALVVRQSEGLSAPHMPEFSVMDAKALADFHVAYTRGVEELPEGKWVVVEHSQQSSVGPSCGLNKEYWMAQGLKEEEAIAASEYRFAVRKGRTDKLHIEFMGGGACWSEETCKKEDLWYHRTDVLSMPGTQGKIRADQATCLLNGQKLCLRIGNGCPCAPWNSNCFKQNADICTACANDCTYLGLDLTVANLCKSPGSAGLLMHECAPSSQDPAKIATAATIDASAHPYAEHTHVLVTYCTGDLHMGTQQKEYSGDLTVNHYGAINTRYVLDWVAQHFPSEQVEELAVTGCSAGAYAAPFWSDALLTPKTQGGYGYKAENAVVVSDAGIGVVTNEFIMQGFANWGVMFSSAIPDNTPCNTAQIFRALAAAHPEASFGITSNKDDQTQLQFAQLMDPSITSQTFAQCSARLMSEFEYPLTNNLHSYFYNRDKTFHCVTGNNIMYTETCNNGVSDQGRSYRLVDWMADIMSNAHRGQTQCSAAISAADCEYIPTVTCPKVIPEIDATTTTHQATQTFSLLSYFPQSPASPLKNALGYHFDMAVDPRALLQGSSTYVTLSEDTVAQLQNALQLNAKTGRLEVLSERLAGIAAGRYMIHIG